MSDLGKRPRSRRRRRRSVISKWLYALDVLAYRAYLSFRDLSEIYYVFCALPLPLLRRLRVTAFVFPADQEEAPDWGELFESRQDALEARGISDRQAQDFSVVRRVAYARAEELWDVHGGPSWELAHVCIAYGVLTGLREKLEN